MSYEDMRRKPFIYFSAVKDIVLLFAEQELGSGCEVDDDAVITYVTSAKFSSDTFEYCTKEDIYQRLTDDILDGWPVWEFLKVPEWTKKMLERSFTQQRMELQQELEKKYVCYTCKYFEQTETSLGVLTKCFWKPPKNKNETENGYRLRAEDWRRSRVDFNVKKKCKHYERREENEE